MAKYNDLSDLSLSMTEFDEKKAKFKNHSTKISATVGFLLGVKPDYLKFFEEDDLIKKLQTNTPATIIRSLNNIRSNLILSFKDVSRSIRIDSTKYIPLFKQELFKDDFRVLSRNDIFIETGRTDLKEYLQIINDEILKRIDTLQNLFPDWLEFKYIRNMFYMANIDTEIAKFQTNQNYYPYKQYFCWKNPYKNGNILYNDEKFLGTLYADYNITFTDNNRVVTASLTTQNNINIFINEANKIQIFVDGENVSPYNVSNVLHGLSDDEIHKIDRIIVYYDALFSDKSWTMLKHFSCDINVETIAVSRITENKSLVDHKLVAGISKSFYKDDIDSFIIMSSDSDFWSVIEDLDAKFLVMVEHERCSFDFKNVLKTNNIFYGYMDSFQIPENDLYFKTVLNKELESILDSLLNEVNLRALFNKALSQSRANLTKNVYNVMYNKFKTKIRIDIDEHDNVHLAYKF